MQPLTYTWKVMRSGSDGIAVRIPHDIARLMKLQKGDYVEIKIVKIADCGDGDDHGR